jgi:prepilin peptidase CpaA
MSEAVDVGRMVLLIAVTLVAATTDVRRGVVPNALTIPAFVAALALTFAGDGVRGFAMTLLVAGGVVAAGTVAHACGVLGGGDVKLLAFVGAAMAPLAFVETLFWIAVWSVVFAIVLLGWRRRLVPLVRGLARGSVEVLAFGLAPSPVVEGGGTRFSYAVVVAFGVVTSLLARWQALAVTGATL